MQLKKREKLMYETKIRTTLWWAYGIPGNIGWILYLLGLGEFAAKGGFAANLSVGILLVILALLMLIGIAELVSERIHKLDRKLPALRFWRSFDAMPCGGLLGAVLSAVTLQSNFSTGNSILMLIGGILCFVFAGLIAVSVNRNHEEG